MKKSPVVFFIHFFALLLLIYNQILTQTSYQKWVWFAWFINYFSSLSLISFFAVFSYFKSEEKDFKVSLRYLFLFVPITFGHFIFGAFFSFFAQMEPLDFFGPNGYINHFDVGLFFEKLGPIPLAYWLYLGSKIYLFEAKASQKMSSFTYLADPLLLLIGSVGITLILMSLGVDVKSPSQLALIGSCSMVLVFIPWRLLFQNDVGSLIDDQEAHVKPNQNTLPLTVRVDGAKGWGLLSSLFGLMFISVALGVVKFILQSFNNGQYGSVVGLIFGMLFFLGIGLLFFSIGLNLNWAYKVYQIDSQTIYFEQKAFLPWPKSKKWSVPRHQYLAPEKVVRQVRHAEGPSYKVYKIILRRKPEFKLNSRNHLMQLIFSSNEVLLYEAYFEKNFDETFVALKKTLV